MKITLIVLVLAMFLVSGCAIKDCQTDLNCFKELVKDCSKAKVNIIYDDNNLRLTSRGIWLEDCRLSFKIEQFNEYCSGPIKDALQGPLKNAVKEKMGMNIPLN